MVKKSEVLSSRYATIDHIDWFFKITLDTGYYYFEWKDKVYKVSKARRSYEETGFLYSELTDE
jgi:hypothetical protein